MTHRLVARRREGDKVRPKTLLNLGRTFSIAKEDWRLVCQRVDELMTHQTTLNFMTLPAEIETEARRIAKRRLERQEHRSETPDWERVDVHSLQNSDARSIGIEHAAIATPEPGAQAAGSSQSTVCTRSEQTAAGLCTGQYHRPDGAAGIGTGDQRLVAHMNRTGSATGELLGIDFGALSDRTLYRASDHLFKHKTALEDHRIGTVETLFNRPPVVTLYDLTNTYFEGEVPGQPKAKHGHSKERRTVSVSDAPLLTLPEGLGAVLDSSGFLRRTGIVQGDLPRHLSRP